MAQGTPYSIEIHRLDSVDAGLAGCAELNPYTKIAMNVCQVGGCDVRLAGCSAGASGASIR